MIFISMNMCRSFSMGSILIFIILFEVYPLCLTAAINSSRISEPELDFVQQNSKEQLLPNFSLINRIDTSNSSEPLSFLGGFLNIFYKHPSRSVKLTARKLSKNKVSNAVAQKPDAINHLTERPDGSISGFGKTNKRKFTTEKTKNMSKQMTNSGLMDNISSSV